MLTVLSSSLSDGTLAGVGTSNNLTSADIAAALPAGTSMQLTSAGLEIQPAAVSGEYVPQYSILDSNPQVDSSGVLVPFSGVSPTGLTPGKMRHAYGIDQISFGNIQGDGTGQTIAIVDAYDYPTVVSDLHNFSVAFGLPDATVTRVNEDGGTALPGTDPAGKGNDWEIEEALDVEWVHAIAPGASILLVEATSPTDSDLIAHAVNYARNAPGVVAVTMSFGRTEDSTVTGLDQYFTTPVGHAGVTFLASTGDSGAPGGYPAKSPNVVAVGGTTLTVDGSGNYVSETAWSGSGGGLSTFESQPPYQNGVVTQSGTQRAVPDVAFDADPASGASIYDSYDFGTAAPWLTVGGTSLSSPCWAAMIAIADQGRSLSGAPSLDGIGKTLPKLYQLASSDFHDITVGSNGNPAGVGYDLVTGRGSPIANLLIPQLSAAGPFVVSSSPSGAQIVSPASISFNFSGAMDPTSFSVANDVDSFTGPGKVDLTSSITGYSWSNGNSTLNILFASPTVGGSYSLAIGPQILSVGGATMDQNQNGIAGEGISDQYAATWGYDTSPLQVTSTIPTANSSVQLPLSTVDVHFNEPFNPASVDTSDLTLSQGTVTRAVVVDSTTVRYTLGNVTAEGVLTLTMQAGALTKAADGFPMQAYSTTFTTDIGTVALPAPVGVAPSGSLIYQTSTSGFIGSTTDTDSFTITLDPGQTLAVMVNGASVLVPTILVMDPLSNVLGTTTAIAPGKSALLQTLPVATAGTYTITVGGGGTTGIYTVSATLNASQQAAAYGGATNQSLATAQNIDASFISLGGNASRGAVIGGTVVGALSSIQDYYAFTLNAGDVASLALKAATAGADDFKILDGSGNILASSSVGAINVDRSIARFVAPTTGTYYIFVSAASGGSPYSLVVARNAIFSLEPHGSFSTPEDITGTSGALGSILGGGSGTVTLNSTTDGWWDSTGAHDATNSNFITGINESTNQHRSYYVFNLGSVTQTVIGAQLNIQNPSNGFLSVDPTENLGFFDISTPLGTIESSGSGQLSIFNDLGTGTNYGNTTVSAASNGGIVTTTLNNAGISAINAVLGGQFDLGGAITTLSGTSSQYVFGFSSGTLLKQLVLTLGNSSDWYSVNVTNPSQGIAFITSTPGGGTGQFTNNLNPHIELYDPNGNLVASGTKLLDGRNENLSYQALSTGTYRIRVTSLSNTAGEYVLNVGNALNLSLPSDLAEGTSPTAATVTVSTAPTSDLVVNLASSDPGRLSLPATVVLPAGQTSITFPITAINNALLDGLESVNISASAANYFSSVGSVTVHDDETATLNVLLPANSLEGSGPLTGTVTASAAPTRDIVIQLGSSNLNKLTVPATVTLKAGQTSVNFTANVVDNTAIDGTQNATVTASVDNWTSGNATVAIGDNDGFVTVTLPTSGWEGQTLTGAGTVTIGGTLSTNLTINLSSNNIGELSIPSSVTILAGQTSATFTLTLLQDGVKAGLQNVTVSANATGLTGGNRTIAIHDSTLDHIGIDPISGLKTAGIAFPVLVHAYNISKEVIATYAGNGTLSASGNSGIEPVSPSSFTYSNGTWAGNPILTVADANVTFSTATGGLSVSSNSFAVQAAAVASFSWGNVTTPEISNVPFGETVTATDAFGNIVTNYNGSANLTGMVGTTVSANMLGNLTYTTSNNNGAYTVGYAFTPNTTIQVTGVRSYFGTKVSIWTSTGTLLTSQAVSGSATTWIQTPLTTPVTLVAGTTYRLTVYTAGQIYYWRNTPPTNPSFAALGQTYEILGDGFPTNTDTGQYWLVDLTANISTGVSVPVTPTAVTFANGTWTGNITVTQPALAMHLNMDDGFGHIGASGNFDVIPRALTLSLPTDVQENAGSVSGSIHVLPAPTSDLVVTLTNSDPTRLGVPSTVTIPAGQTSASFTMNIIDNTLFDGLEGVTITSSAAGYPTTSTVVNVHDDETVVLSASLPSSVNENAGTIVGTITASAAPTRDITVALTSSNPSRAAVPATITLKAGQTTANFNISVVNNTFIDGNALITIQAAADNWTAGNGSLLVIDDDNTISIQLPASGFEGQTFVGGGTVRIGGTLSTSLVVNLASNNTTELTVPSSVIIPAGQTTATFNVTMLDDGIKGGTQTVTVTGTAGGLVAGSANTSVHDATLDHMAFDPVGATQVAGVAFPLIVRAYNMSNEVISDYSGNMTLGAIGQGGNDPVSPISGSFAGGMWSGNATLTLADPAVYLQVVSGGLIGSSNLFSVQPGAVSKLSWGPVPSPQVAGIPFSDSVTATDAFGNVATNYNGSANLSGMIGTSISENMLGNLTDTTSNNGGTYTVGYDFTPSTTIQVTGVRSYFGTKVSIWTNTGTLLTSQAVSGTATSWTQTSLTAPVTLVAGTTYRLTVYTAGQIYYWRDVPPTNPSFATLGQTYETGGDGFPTSTDTGQYWLVDLTANVSTGGSVPVTPSAVTFANGTWTGNITVNQVALAMHLTMDDGFGHSGVSGNFNVIQQKVTLSVPTDIQENGGTFTGTINISPTAGSDSVVTLTSSDPARLSVPLTVTIPAGQSSATFPITAIDNALLDGPKGVTLTASLVGYLSSTRTITVHDDESAALSFILPTSVVENARSAVGTVVASAAPTRDITIQLSSDNTSLVTVPPTVILKAGQTTVTFNLSIINNTLIAPNPPVNITASADNWTTATQALTVIDDDGSITVSLPVLAWEGQVLVGGGSVAIGGAFSSDLIVTLSTNNTSEMSLPPTVTIPAGQTSALFNITLLNDGLKLGTQNVTVSASAVGLTAGSSMIAVHDSTLDHFVFNPIAGSVTAGAPLFVTVRADNVANESIATYTGTAVLTATGQGGVEQVSPTSLTFKAGIFSANAILTKEDSAASLNVTAGSVTGQSNAFMVTAAALSAFTWGSVPGTETANVPFSETLTAIDVYGNVVSNYNGTAFLQGIGGVTTSGNMLGTPASTNSAIIGTLTVGYSFTPNTNLQVTSVRSYFGSKITIWDNSGNVLFSEAVAGAAATWTNTPLLAPITLFAGTTYRVSALTGGKTYYWRNVAPPAPSFATLGQNFQSAGDAFPTTVNVGKWWLVDLQVNVLGGFTGISISPGVATFSNGLWTGNITVPQVESVVKLHAFDGFQHTGDTGLFNVVAPPLVAPVLLPISDTGISNSDGSTNLNNSVPAEELAFSVGNTLIGANITLYANGVAIGSAVSNGTTTVVTTNGNITIPDGVASIVARENLAGTQYPDSAATLITIDTVAPNVTVTTPPTSDTMPAISGTIGDPTAAIRFTINGTTYTGVNDGAGHWSLPGNSINPALTPGSYLVSVVATDYVGNSSSVTSNLTIVPLANLTSVKIDDGSAQRSMVRSITLTFDRAVFLSANALTLSLLGGTTVPLVVTPSADNKTFVITFSGPGIIGGSLTDGSYSLLINSAAIHDTYNQALAGGNHTTNFTRLFGDSNGDGYTDSLEAAAFLRAFGKSVGQLGYNSAFDYDGNGIIDANDNVAFRLRLGKHV